MGTTANIDPVDGWKIVNGKLYLNYNREIQNKWLKDIPGFIEGADKNWPKIKHQTAAELKAALGKS